MGEARRRGPHLGWLCTRAEVALDRWEAACGRAADLLSDRSGVC